MTDDDARRIGGPAAIIWAGLTLVGLAASFGLFQRGFDDRYSSAQGMRYLVEQPALFVGSHFALGLGGVALILTVLAVQARLIAEDGYLARAATVFGVLAGALAILAGVSGGNGLIDLAYVRSHSPAAAQAAYFPFVLVVQKMTAAGFFVLGCWLIVLNWLALRAGTLPSVAGAVGVLAGGLLAVGFLMPAVIGFPGLLLGMVWMMWVGLRLLRGSTRVPLGT